MNKTKKGLLVAGGVVAGAVGIVSAILLWPKSAAASGAPLSGGQVDFAPGVTRNDKLQVGGTITIALPPGHTYHMDDFVGGGAIVSVSLSDANASTGYRYLALRAESTGKVTAILDTRGDTAPMTLNIEVV